MIVGRTQRRVLYLVLGALWSSGVGFWWLDSQGAEPRQLRLPLLAVHGAMALLFAAVVGSLWPRHVARAWRALANRPSGAFLVTACAALALTGWSLYYSGGSVVREWLRDVHVWLGLVLPAVLVVHILLGRVWRRKLLAARAAHLRRSVDQPKDVTTGSASPPPIAQ